MSFIYAQDTNLPVEIRLKLIEENNDKGVKELSLSVSIINHSGLDIYIPNFKLYAIGAGIHFYQKEGGLWREIDINTQNYYKPIVPHRQIVGKDTIMSYHGNGPVYSVNNSITKKYMKYTYQLSRNQDSIIQSFYNSAPDHHQIDKIYTEDKKPLFLKAKETLNNYYVRNVDYLLTKKMAYKIAFNSELRDSLRYFREPRVYSDRIKKYVELNFPEYIYEYKLFYPKEIKSNIIYYTNKEVVDK